jgi:hypothetical protein
MIQLFDAVKFEAAFPNGAPWGRGVLRNENNGFAKKNPLKHKNYKIRIFVAYRFLSLIFHAGTIQHLVLNM